MEAGDLVVVVVGVLELLGGLEWSGGNSGECEEGFGAVTGGILRIRVLRAFAILIILGVYLRTLRNSGVLGALIKSGGGGTYLVVQWLRICFAMQGMQV